jgi:hypothetical protein
MNPYMAVSQHYVDWTPRLSLAKLWYSHIDKKLRCFQNHAVQTIYLWGEGKSLEHPVPGTINSIQFTIDGKLHTSISLAD